MLSTISTHYDAERREWSGPKRRDLYNDALTLGEIIYDVLSKNPKKIIQIYDVTGETMTCEELLKYSEQLSKYLIIELGLKAGDVVGLYAANSTHVTTVLLASFLCGTPVNALYSEFDKETVSSIYKVSRPKVIFCDVKNYENMRCVNEELNLGATIFVLNGAVKGATNIRDLLHKKLLKDCNSFSFPCLDLHGDTTAVIVCSSGTTGPPKGVLCSHRALFNQNLFLGIQSTSVIFTFSAMYWHTGVWSMVESLVNGCLRIITDKPFTPEYFFELVKRYQISHIVANTSHMTEVALLKDTAKTQEALASIYSIIVCGAKVPLVTREKMHQILSKNRQGPGLVVAYGLSELGGALSCNSKYLTGHLVGSEGKLIANKKVRIVNKNNELLGPNEHGEICISTPYTWLGYYKNGEATRKAVRGNWLYTGDIGYFNDEGFLHVCNRNKDIFKSRNFQIYPHILEDIVMRLKGVLEVCVFGIPDLVATHLTACAVSRTSDDVGLSLKAEDVHQMVKKNIGVMYHLGGGVYFVDAIPKTFSGKVQRIKVLQMVMKMKGKCA